MIAPRTVAWRRHVRLPCVRRAVMVVGHGHGAGRWTLRTVFIAGDPRRRDRLVREEHQYDGARHAAKRMA